MRLRSSVTLLMSRGLMRLTNSCTSALNAWHDFWFRPVDPLMIGLIRLLTGWMLLYNLLVWGLDLDAFFGDHGLQPLASIQSLHEGDPVFSFWLWTGDQWLWPIHYACVAIAALFFLGVASRLTSILCFLITISYSQRVPVANFGFDQILGFLCLYLSLAPSGASLSIDALIRRSWSRRRGLSLDVAPSSSARMASRLIQLHLCAIYLWAGFSKLKGPSWWTGEAMWRVIANQEYQTTDLTWMAQMPWLPYLIAHITIAWEVFFIVLVWSPRWRPLMLFMGVLMHLGIGAFLGMWTFGLIMAFAYLAFSDAELWRARLNRMFGRSLHANAATNNETKAIVGVIDQDISAMDQCIANASGNTCHLESVDDESLYVNEFLELNVDANFDTSEQSDLHIVDEVGPSRPVDAEVLPVESVQPDVPEFLVLSKEKISTECDAEPESVNSVCVIAANSDERTALRRHLRSHAFQCVAVPEPGAALTAISRNRFDVILLHSSGLSSKNMIDFCEDVADLTGRPVVVLLRASQTHAIDHLSQIRGVSCLVLPASLKEVRRQVESVMVAFRSHHAEVFTESKT